jgi:hypothetical protein
MAKSKVATVLGEYKRGKLHSGSKQGPKVKKRSQAIAIALNQARKEGEDVSPAPSKFKAGRGRDRGDK